MFEKLNWICINCSGIRRLWLIFFLFFFIFCLSFRNGWMNKANNWDFYLHLIDRFYWSGIILLIVWAAAIKWRCPNIMYEIEVHESIGWLTRVYTLNLRLWFQWVRNIIVPHFSLFKCIFFPFYLCHEFNYESHPAINNKNAALNTMKQMRRR